MVNVTTQYENLGPELKHLHQLNVDDFFQFPEEGTIYRLVSRHADKCACLSLDDLQVSSFPSSTFVETRVVNSINIKVELL